MKSTFYINLKSLPTYIQGKSDPCKAMNIHRELNGLKCVILMRKKRNHEEKYNSWQ